VSRRETQYQGYCWRPTKGGQGAQKRVTWGKRGLIQSAGQRGEKASTNILCKCGRGIERGEHWGSGEEGERRGETVKNKKKGRVWTKREFAFEEGAEGSKGRGGSAENAPVSKTSHWIQRKNLSLIWDQRGEGKSLLNAKESATRTPGGNSNKGDWGEVKRSGGSTG